MTWVKGPTKYRPHKCQRPSKAGIFVYEPPGQPGDVWRCDVCGKLWVIEKYSATLIWVSAYWRLRWKYRKDGWKDTTNDAEQDVQPGTSGTDQ